MKKIYMTPFANNKIPKRNPRLRGGYDGEYNEVFKDKET